MSPTVQKTPTPRDYRVIEGMEAAFAHQGRLKLVDGIPIPRIVTYLRYALTAVDEKKADLGILVRCPNCHSPVTEPVFDPAHNFVGLDHFFPRWCSEVCRDLDLERRHQRDVAKAKARQQRKDVA